MLTTGYFDDVSSPATIDRRNASAYDVEESATTEIPSAVFLAEAVDPDAAIWYLLVDSRGHAMLQYDEDIVAGLTWIEGSSILRSERNLMERVEEFLAAILSQLAVQMHERARTSLESDLSRWVIENF